MRPVVSNRAKEYDIDELNMRRKVRSLTEEEIKFCTNNKGAKSSVFDNFLRRDCEQVFFSISGTFS